MSSRPKKMSFMYRSVRLLKLLSVLSASLLWGLSAYATMDPRFEIDAQSLGASAVSKSIKNKPKAIKHTSFSNAGKSLKSGSARVTTHFVKSGDNLFKILMRDYGLSNNEAEMFIEVIRRENNIYDIRRLKVGQKIIIPAVRRNADGALIGIALLSQSDADAPGSVGQSFRLNAPEGLLSEKVAILRVQQAWDQILPPLNGAQKPVMLDSPTFSLTLDTQRYPVFATMDNGRILVDQNANIPPLVKTLIMEKDASVRFVSESPVNGKRFLAAMLDSAGFYSVENDLHMEFGNDPKLTIRSDFKIEKTPESLMKQDVILMNSGPAPLPSVLGNFLKKEGFSVYEPFASLQPIVPTAPQPLFQITTKSQIDTLDALLASFSVNADKSHHLDVFAKDDNGISLSVKAERYFERGGQRHVVSRFDGDPLTYTLFRILEAKGYQVTILEAQDDFRKITDKLLSSMGIQAAYAQHMMNNETGANYSIQMSGYKLEGAGFPVDGLFLTDLELDHVVHDLLSKNGYTIIIR